MLNFLSASTGYMVAPRSEAYTPGPIGQGFLSSIRTVFLSTTTAPLTDEYQFCAHDDLISGESKRSVVHLTSSAVEAEPSGNLALGSRWKTQLKASAPCSQEAARPGTTLSLSSDAVSDSEECSE